MVTKALTNVDQELCFEINDSGRYTSDYWSFKSNSDRKYSHLFFNYPAMMVPAMQSELIDIISRVQGNIKNVVDPFVGSGTTMIESMLRGFNFCGQDINPLAILVCNSKKVPFYEKSLHKKIDLLFEQISKDKNNNIEVNFNNIDKWFRKDVQVALSQIRRNIRREPSKWARQFMWVAFAETIRLSSNSRTSTFKLHIRPKEEIENRKIDVINKFKSILQNNFDNLILQKEDLSSKNLLSKSTYKKRVKIILNDSSKKILLLNNKKYDLLISSPPYGDNHTTVTYGQFSYLPLQWIDMSDIHPKIDSTFTQNTNYIDTLGLGGRKNKNSDIESELKDYISNFT
jgi:hypothetical protein